MPIRRPFRLAAALWIVWAVAVWNVVFDRVLVLAGRRFVSTAAAAARGSGPYLLIKDAMEPAVVRAFWGATLAGSAILLVGAVTISLAFRSRVSKVR